MPAIEEFLRRENALDNNRFLLESVRNTLRNGLLNGLLRLPKITKENIDLVVKSWGSDVLYDFILETGLLGVKCKSRDKLVTTLVDQIRKQQNRPSISAEKVTFTVGQPAKQENPL